MKLRFSVKLKNNSFILRNNFKYKHYEHNIDVFYDRVSELKDKMEWINHH